MTYDSTDVCFLLHKYTGTQFRNTMNPVRDRWVTVSAACSTSTFALITNPLPHGSGMLGSSSFVPCKCPNSLDVQSWASNSDLSTHGSLRSYTISVCCGAVSDMQRFRTLGLGAPHQVKPGMMTSWPLPNRCQFVQA